jgi:hypothetical protein
MDGLNTLKQLIILIMKRKICLLLFFALVLGCSEESSSGTSSLANETNLIADKGELVYDSSDSLLTLIFPVCRENAAGNLVWQKQGESVSSKKVLVIKNFNPLKKTARLVELGEDDSELYRYEGSNFPYGLWKEESDVSDVVIDAFWFDEKEGFKDVEIYRGDCLAKDLLEELEDEMDNGFGIDDLKYKNCSELTFLNGKGLLKIRDFSSEVLQLALFYDKIACDFSLKKRYAVYEEDCKAAYEEYLVDDLSDEYFEFDDYDLEFEGDEDCFTELMLKIYVHTLLE